MNRELAGIVAGLKTSADRLERVFRAAMTDTGLPDEAVAAILAGMAYRFGQTDLAATAALLHDLARQLERRAAQAAN